MLPTGPGRQRSFRPDRYQVFVGLGTAFEREDLVWADFPDGLAETILVVEAADPVPWSKPVDVAYSPALPLPRFLL